MQAPGLGQSQRSILEMLKRRGRTTIPELAGALDLNIETVREHLRVLSRHRLVTREGSRRSGPGRPEGMYALTAEAERLFPQREGELLRALATHLVRSGHEDVLHEFLERGIAERREEALARVRDLDGAARLEEVARIFSEFGFMAVTEEHEGELRLRLCHCPIRPLVDATRIPCIAETGLLAELMNSAPIRESYIPAGDAACCYRAAS